MSGQLSFPRIENPAVTIVMVTHGARPVVTASLTALRNNTPANYRLVVVDSSSPDDTASWIRAEVSGIDFHPLEQNLGFGAGSNLGAETATSPYLLFLNPDVMPLAGWLEPLLDAGKGVGVAAAGPRLLYPDGRLQAAGSLVDRTGGTQRHGDGVADPNAAAFGWTRHPDYLSGACMLVSRRAFADLGGFDPVYGMGYFEDVDLCFRLAGAGHRLAYVPASAVVHVRDASGGSRTLASTVGRNHLTFAARWREVLQARPTPAQFREPSGVIRCRDARASIRCLAIGEGAREAASMLAVDPRALVTVVGCEAPWLAGRAEVVPAAEDWAVWFDERRNHYDIVVGDDPRFTELCLRTQPLAHCVRAAAAGALTAAGLAPWPPVFACYFGEHD